jgi:hypothetical protein
LVIFFEDLTMSHQLLLKTEKNGDSVTTTTKITSTKKIITTSTKKIL